MTRAPEPTHELEALRVALGAIAAFADREAEYWVRVYDQHPSIDVASNIGAMKIIAEAARRALRQVV